MKLISLVAALFSSMHVLAITDDQLNYYAERATRLIETASCVEEQLKHELDYPEAVSAIKVNSIKSRNLVQRYILSDDFSNYSMNVSLTYKGQQQNVTCGIWTLGDNTDLIQFCTSGGRPYQLTGKLRYIFADFFVIEKGCF